MTLCNVMLTAERLMMVTDTLVGHRDRPTGFTTKFNLLAHITGALAARGPDDFRHEARLHLDHVYLEAGVETAAKILPPFLADLEARLPSKYVQQDGLQGEVIIAGWAPSRGRFAGWYFGYSDGYQAHELEVDHCHYLPRHNSDYRPIPHVDFGERLIALAKAQHAVMVKETPPGLCPTVGGDLVAVDMTKAGATVRKVARLDGHAELRERLRDGR